MAMTITGAIKSDISVVATNAFDLANGSVPLRNTQTQTTASASATVTCNLLWQDSGTIAGGAAAVDIDLDTSLEDYWGDAADFAKVYAIYIRNTTTGAGVGESIMTIGLDAAPFPWFFGTPATDNIKIEPGGFILSSCGVDAGWAVGAGATDVLQIANDDGLNAMDYEIVIIGKE